MQTLCRADNKDMKSVRIFSLFLLFFSSAFIYSQTPDKIKGIWANDDRLLFFGGDNEISVILKLYYGWYYDRTSENESFTTLAQRNVNNATSPTPIHLNARYKKLGDEINAWELHIYNDDKLIDSIPFCVIDDNIYLNFLIKDNKHVNDSQTNNSERNEKSTSGFWKGVNSRQTIKTCKGISQKEIICWYVENDCAYRLRFWETTMDFDNQAMAAFTDGDKFFSINKHIDSANSIFTCTNGRSSRIRNVEKYLELPFEVTYDETNTIAAIGKPTFKRASEKYSKEDLIAIVNEANRRMCPIPPSPFPVPDFDFEKHHYVKAEKKMTKTDFHWDLIDDMEQGIQIIQEVRERQKRFGPRGKDSGN